MLIGYARVSTHDQNLDLQLDALLKAGCDVRHIYKDTISGAKTERKGLEAALSHLRSGNTLVVWRLDRLGRTLKQLIELINRFNAEVSALKACKRASTRPHPAVSWCSIYSVRWLSLSGRLLKSAPLPD